MVSNKKMFINWEIFCKNLDNIEAPMKNQVDWDKKFYFDMVSHALCLLKSEKNRHIFYGNRHRVRMFQMADFLHGQMLKGYLHATCYIQILMVSTWPRANLYFCVNNLQWLLNVCHCHKVSNTGTILFENSISKEK